MARRRPEFEPGAAGAEAATLNKFSAGVPKNASFLGWGAGGTQIQWLPDAATGVPKNASFLGWGVAQNQLFKHERYMTPKF